MPGRKHYAVLEWRRTRDLALIGNVADAEAKTQFPDWKWTVRANDGYVYTAPVGNCEGNRPARLITVVLAVSQMTTLSRNQLAFRERAAVRARRS